MSQADLLADFDPLYIALRPAHSNPLAKSPSPAPASQNNINELEQRVQARKEAIVAPLLQSDIPRGDPVYPSNRHAQPQRPLAGSPPRRLSGLMQGRGSFGDTSMDVPRSQPSESFFPGKQRRRSSSTKLEYSEFVNAVAVPPPPQPKAGPSAESQHHSEPSTYSAATFSTAIHSAMQSEIANDWIHSAQSLGSSLRNKVQTARASTIPSPTSSRPALAHLFSENTFSSSAPAEKPRRALTYVSGAPGVDFNAQQNWNKGNWSSSPSDPPLPVQLHGSRPGETTILNTDLAEGLRPSLPTRLRIAQTWTLLYSLDQHGVSLSTLYERTVSGMQGRGVSAGCVLVVQDQEGNLFGSFSNEALKKKEGYYGSGECFLWKAEEFKGDFRVGIGVKAYRWTGRNEYFNLCDDEFISFGGGDGKFGLWIDAAFEKGLSSRCLTFDNEVLNWQTAKPGQKEEGKFEVFRVEVWRCGG